MKSIPRSILSWLMLSICIFFSNQMIAQITKEEAKEIVHRLIKSWEKNDSTSFASLLHEDLVFAYPGDRLNKEAALITFNQYQLEKKDIKIYLWDVFLLEDDRFATAYQFAATDRYTNKRQAVSTGIIGKIDDGQVVLLKEYYDEDVAQLQYDGVLPLDEGIVSPWPISIWLRPETID